MSNEHPLLFELAPEVLTPQIESASSIKVHFEDEAGRKAFAQLIGQPVTELTRAVWHPKQTLDTELAPR